VEYPGNSQKSHGICYHYLVVTKRKVYILVYPLIILTMKAKILTYMLAASLLATPIISGCTKHREHREQRPRTIYQVQTKDYGIKVEERHGRKTVEGYKDGYKVKVEEKRDGSYEVKVKTPGEK